MSRILSAAGSLVDTIKINQLTRESRGGRTFWIKRRSWTAGPIMACANQFFHLAGNPIQALTDLPTWRGWEVECFLRLHGEHFQAYRDGAGAVAAEEVPGKNLSQHLNAGTLTVRMFAAAARELRRAHQQECTSFRDGSWSHGDPHAGNFVYEEATDRARLIDFEVMHHATMSAEERQADDLMVFLQDIMGRIAPEQWLPGAHAFLNAYACPEITARLREKLVVPRGLGRVWWAVRTTYLAPSELQRRIRALRASI
jgi:hypothetical protein